MEQVRKVPTSVSVHEFPILRGDGEVGRIVRIEVVNETGDVRVTTTGDVTIVRPFTIAGHNLRDYQARSHLGRPDVVVEPDGGLVIGIGGPSRRSRCASASRSGRFVLRSGTRTSWSASLRA